jgi:hypothetical protein
MLTHFPIGPTEDQTYMVGYETPGCKVRTIVCEHMNEQDAISEAARRNREQLSKENALKAERIACGLIGVYPGLEDRP